MNWFDLAATHKETVKMQPPHPRFRKNSTDIDKLVEQEIAGGLDTISMELRIEQEVT